jgi:NhaP-type Na+/H+ or K+/H+ antiporter
VLPSRVSSTNHKISVVSRIYSCFTDGEFAKKHVPEDLRHILLAEAAANDGLAYPFLSISIYLTVETSVQTAIGKWFLVGWLCLCYWGFDAS